MGTLSKARVAELISQLQQIHQEEVHILQELYGIQSGPETKGGHSPEGSNPATDDDEPDHEVDGSGNSQDDGEPDVFMPPEWSAPWSDELLARRIREREQEVVCGMGGASRSGITRIDPTDPAAKFIHDNALRSLRDFTFEREDPPADWNGKIAFYVIDYDRGGRITLDTRIDSSKLRPGSSDLHDPRRVLFGERSATSSYRREIIVKAFTPSALAAVLLSDTRDLSRDGDVIYTGLRRHLSRRIGDRFFYANHGSLWGPRVSHIGSITVPYFAVTTEPPAKDLAPLSSAGLFGVQGQNRKYIREERFTLSWVRYERGASLVATFGALTDAPQRPMTVWLTNNLRHIGWKWEQVLDFLEEQTSLPSTVIFDGDMRQNLLFDDSNFTNARRYFWALQSLRVFDDHIAGTIRLLSGILHSTRYLDGHELDELLEEALVREFTELRARIERKRQEIESLNDGLFSASSVAESRFSSEQNGNIRLLTLVTIAYLPWSFAATIYGMNVLPEGTTLASFFVVTAILSVITFAVVFNLQLLTVFIRRHILDRTLAGMLRDRNPRWRDRAQRLRQEGQNKRKSFPASKWLYLGYLFHRLFTRKTTETTTATTQSSAEKESKADSKV
ncbi:hypothetical protein VTG60DRAFT_7210 [Thermothelomyces hinnuleus]